MRKSETLTALSALASAGLSAASCVVPLASGLGFSDALSESGLAFFARRGMGCADGVREAAAGGAGVRRVTTMAGEEEDVHQADYMRESESRLY